MYKELHAAVHSSIVCHAFLLERTCERDQKSLPESRYLPSAYWFAEYFPSGTQQTASIPSAATKTIGTVRIGEPHFT